MFSISISFPSDSFTVQISRTSAFIYDYFYFSKRQDALKMQSLAVATHTSFMGKTISLTENLPVRTVLPIIL